ncbi:protein IQ-DOMAIN 31-like isoform X1 [Triticum dicoccoides]|uniref:protein IQ-DOMAIN 31-like isoform X1 n=1 Tax=Triticum dicoccoides TaxID=85692 RepID=UPI000E7CC992|nr:protein IQ-DOMAIN 31-like isoform X1 [Triticum dicoccoides]
MGKSPAKWLKSVLFGKKTSRSGSAKAKDLSKAGGNRGYVAAGKEPGFSESSPVISEPVLVTPRNNDAVPEVGKGENSSSQGEAAAQQEVNHDLEKQSTAGSDVLSNDPERLKEEQAAVKAQAAFRGYLARRAFRALKGIIRLQALIRGHLVRRQAASTLRATWLIVKFQAIVRGRNVRLSSDAIQFSWKLAEQKSVGAKPDAWRERLASNAFARKLLASPILVEALHFQYDERDPNSAFNWLERWTISRVWKPVYQTKRNAIADAKPQTKRASYAMETESGKLKRNARKSSALSVEPIPLTNMPLETEKTRRTPRKFTSTPADSVPDSQLTELEKVKRSLRKVTNSMAEASKVSSPACDTPDHPEIECEKPQRTAQEVPVYPEIQEPNHDDQLENAKVDIFVPDLKPEGEVTPYAVTSEEKLDEPAVVATAAEVMPLQDIDNEENALVNDAEQRSREEPLSAESLKGGNRRSSFSTKPEYPENGSKNSPAVPSYMAATKSAKAKLRGQISPRLSADSAEKTVYTRRHSLPSPANGKQNSHSPRTQRPIHPGTKEGAKVDKSMLSSRDAAERPMKAEWRR